MSHPKWSPLHDLGEFVEPSLQRLSGWGLAADVGEDEDNIFVEIQIPGIDPEKIEIEVENHYLRVSGSREEKREERKKNYYYKEIKRGRFERTIDLPYLVDQNNVLAEAKDGVLRITLPKKRGKQASKISVIKRN